MGKCRLRGRAPEILVVRLTGAGIGSAGEGKALDGDANPGECRTSRSVGRKPHAYRRGDVVYGDRLSRQCAR